MNQSPNLTKEEILKIAQLAHLAVSDTEAEKLRGDLSAILVFVQKLEGLMVEGVEPTSHAGGIPSALRDDEARLHNDRDKNRIKNMIDQFPAHNNNFLQVPPIFQDKNI